MHRPELFAQRYDHSYGKDLSKHERFQAECFVSANIVQQRKGTNRIFKLHPKIPTHKKVNKGR